MGTPKPKPASSDASVLIGRTIAGRYRVDSLIGEGAMGAVFRCHHLGLKRDVAVKLLHPELTDDEQVSARFDREARSASRLSHPNCVRVTDFGTWAPPGMPGVKYMAMQLLEGSELTELMSAPLPPKYAIELMLQVVKALEHAHGKGVVHRDLKPENIFVTVDNDGKEQLKLVDFGIAKIVTGEDAKVQMTRAGLVFGTPRYMSPEQAAGSPVDERADIYSAGVILYQMLAGKPPFDAEDLVVLVRMQIAGTPPPLPQTVPLPVRAVVGKMMEKDRAHRYPTATALREALEEVLRGLEAQANVADATISQGTLPVLRTPTIPPAAQEFLRSPQVKRWGPIAGVVFVALLLIVWGAASRDDETDVADADEESLSAMAREKAAQQRAKDEAAARADKGSAAGSGGALVEAAVKIVRAPAAEISAVDKLWVGGNFKKADQQLRVLADGYPNDPQLLWRRGRSLARKKDRSAEALVHYEDAIEHDAALLEDRHFYSELTTLMRRPALVQHALDIALRRMGTRGHAFLLEIVGRQKPVLGYQDRHRALAELGKDEANRSRIDHKLHRALDLWQAGQAREPCDAFARALTEIDRNADPYFLGTVHKVGVPTPNEEAGDADAQLCVGLPMPLALVRAGLAAKYPLAEKEWTYPAAYTPKKKRRRRFRLFR